MVLKFTFRKTLALDGGFSNWRENPFFLAESVRNLKFSGGAVLMLCVFSASCATQKPLAFIEARDIRASDSIVIHNIDDFENIIKKNKIDTVFYTDEYFIVQINSVLYSHISRGYKSFREYREGKLEKPERWAIFKQGYSD
ncbi:MAG: hypothetical protein LBB22_02675 [Treponema sp.]|jgi:uncharacterized protein YdaL|nr:hypothetical protein [Treponema sp.]